MSALWISRMRHSALVETMKKFFSLVGYSLAATTLLLRAKFERSIIYKNVEPESERSEFAKLCDRWGSDKDCTSLYSINYPWRPHNYGVFYSGRFSEVREQVEAVFECGIGTSNSSFSASMGSSYTPGASLRVWKDYFPNALVFGIDIDPLVLFQEERIRTYLCDQTSETQVRQLFTAIGQRDFDLIVDDGLHSFYAGLRLFQNASHRLKNSGSYVIEDVTPGDCLRYLSFFTRSKEWQLEIVSLKRRGVWVGDNRLVVVTRKSHNS